MLRKDIPRLENTVNAIGVQEDIKVLYEQFSSLLVSFYQRYAKSIVLKSMISIISH